MLSQNPIEHVQQCCSRKNIKGGVVMEMKNMVAATTGEGNIGNLTWYTIALTGIKSKELEQLLQTFGFEKYMLRPRNPADAARCAMTDSAEQSSPDQGNTINKLFFSEVYSDKKEVIWKLVGEQVDRQGKKLRFDPEIATIRFDKETCNPEVVDCKLTEANALIYHAFDLYQVYRETYTSRHIREMLGKILGDMCPIPVRPSGGVYFVPAAYEEQLSSLIHMTKQIGDSEAEMVPLYDTHNNKDMVRRKLKDHIKSVVGDVANILKQDDVTKGVAVNKLNEVKKVLSDFEQYRSDLNISIEDMNEMLDILQMQSKCLIDKVTDKA